jgi:hypothetical protein
MESEYLLKINYSGPPSFIIHSQVEVKVPLEGDASGLYTLDPKSAVILDCKD